MNVWIVNPFDPLPGDPEQEGRYATLARLLAARGHGVTWWTSAFSHRFRRPVDPAAILAACRPLGLEVRFLAAPPYERNISLSRLRNHRRLVIGFAAGAAAEPRRPDIVVASSPPPALAREAVRFAHACGGKAVVDVQDLWPEAFRAMLPLPGFLADALVEPWQRASRQAYREADALVGVADGFVARAVELGGPKAIAETIPLGVDLDAFDRAVAAGRCDRFTKPPGEAWLIYGGSLTRNYECLTLLEAAARLKNLVATPWRLFLAGRGELEPQADDFIRQRGLDNVTLTGFLTLGPYAYLMSQCDAAFNPVLPAAPIYLPGKVFHYMAAGAAILNGIGGQCSRIVREAGCGLDYEAGNPDSCAAAAARLIGDPPACKAMGAAARRLAETQYNRRILYRRYVDAIERVAAWR
jgi:glycosyltransferase involved in cell wall biosynthesis